MPDQEEIAFELVQDAYINAVSDLQDLALELGCTDGYISETDIGTENFNILLNQHFHFLRDPEGMAEYCEEYWETRRLVIQRNTIEPSLN